MSLYLLLFELRQQHLQSKHEQAKKNKDAIIPITILAKALTVICPSMVAVGGGRLGGPLGGCTEGGGIAGKGGIVATKGGYGKG